MVPVNLIKEIGYMGFDYDLSPREVAKRVVFGQRVSGSMKDSDRRGGALTLWKRSVVLDGSRSEWDFSPSEEEIMADVPPPFPYDAELGKRRGDPVGGVVTDRLARKEPVLPKRVVEPGPTESADPTADPLKGLKQLLSPIPNLLPIPPVPDEEE